MQEFTKHLPEFAANLVVLLGAIAAAVAGGMATLKKVKLGFGEVFKNDSQTVEKTQIVGGMLQDAFSTAMMSENIRDLKEEIEDNTREMREIRHVLDRILDRMNQRHDRRD